MQKMKLRNKVWLFGVIVTFYVTMTWLTNLKLTEIVGTRTGNNFGPGTTALEDDEGYGPGNWRRDQDVDHKGQLRHDFGRDKVDVEDDRLGNGGVKVVDSASYQQASGRLDRVYCMVPCLYSEKAKPRLQAVLETWGKRCDILKFFVDKPKRDTDVIPPSRLTFGSASADIVQIDMVRDNGGMCEDGRPCRHIWEKVWRSWVYVYENDLNKAEIFLKVDDDTYFIPSNIRRWVRDKNWSADDPHYFGHVVYINRAPFRLISGVCTAFSREAIRRLGPKYLSMEHEYGPRKNFPNSHGTCVDRDGATEERVTSKCLEEVGVYAEETLENGQSEAVLPLGLPWTLIYKRKANSTSWYWWGKPWTRGDKTECCSRTYTWGIHGYKGNGQRMVKMDEMMTKWSMAKLEKMKSSEPYMSEKYVLYDFLLDLRKSIQEDPFAY